MKYLCSTVDPIVAEQIYTRPELSSIPRIFIHQFNNFYIADIWIYSAAFPEIFVSDHFPKRYIRKQK